MTRLLPRLVLLLTFSALSALLPATAHAERAVGLVRPATLVTFDTSNPADMSAMFVSGLGAGQSLVGIDTRPSSGALYGFAVPSSSPNNSVVFTYTINLDTGAATLVGQTAAAIAGVGDLASGITMHPGVGASPPSERSRLVNSSDENVRLNPDTGALSGNDTDLTPAINSDMIAMATDEVIYTGNPTTPTYFAINRATNSLGRIGDVDGTPLSANAGVITTIGSLGITLDLTSDGGLDISPQSGTTWATLATEPSAPGLYTINLATGAATFVGPLAVGVDSLAMLPDLPAPPADTTSPLVLAAPPASIKLTALRRSRQQVAFSCSEACTATATLTGKLGTRKLRTLAAGSASLAAVGVGNVKLTPNAGARKLLTAADRTRRGRYKARLTIVFKDTAGNAATRSYNVTLTS